MPRPDEGMIHAWLDGELSPDEAARVARLAEQDPEWRAAVAEARGLIAASSRIVRALDAVPGGVVPAKAPAVRRAFRVRPWVGIAAGLALVAGTAYVMRDATETAFAPATGVVAEASAPPPAPRDQEAVSAREVQAPTTTTVAARDAASAADAASVTGAVQAAAAGSGARAMPSTPAASTLGAVSGSLGSSASVNLADSARQDLRRAEEEVRTQAKAAAELLVARAGERALERNTSAQRLRAEADRTTGRAAPAAALSEVAAAPAPAALPTPRVLDGCWLASAPAALAKLHRDLVIVRVAGDSLELRVTPTETVVVVREGDALRGGLTARRTECPAVP